MITWLSWSGNGKGMNCANSISKNQTWGGISTTKDIAATANRSSSLHPADKISLIIIEQFNIHAE